MEKKTVLQEVKDRMKDLLEKREAELQSIQLKKEEAWAQKETAEKALKAAMEKTDLSAYDKANQAIHKAQTAIDMYSARYDQLKALESVTEDESDKVVDSLLSYEDDLAEEFKAAIADPINELVRIFEEYRNEVADTEGTIKAWGINVHANYNSRGTTHYRDETTGQRTTRSPKPIPVHMGGYAGCAEAGMLKRALIELQVIKN